MANISRTKSKELLDKGIRNPLTREELVAIFEFVYFISDASLTPKDVLEAMMDAMDNFGPARDPRKEVNRDSVE